MTGLRSGAVLGALLAASCPGVHAQVATQPDGQWRALVGAAYSRTSGNANASTLSVKADAARATPDDKWTLHAEALRARTEGVTSGNRARLDGRYDWNLSPRTFSFGSAGAERDTIALLDSRLSLGGGLGYKLIDRPETSFNVFGGLSFTDDRYAEPRLIGDRLRDHYGRPTAVLGEESTHKFNASTSANQRLVLNPDLSSTPVHTAQWDAGLAVAMTRTMNLTFGVSVHYSSVPGAGLKNTDTLVTTGVAVKFD